MRTPPPPVADLNADELVLSQVALPVRTTVLYGIASLSIAALGLGSALYLSFLPSDERNLAPALGVLIVVSVGALLALRVIESKRRCSGAHYVLTNARLMLPSRDGVRSVPLRDIRTMDYHEASHTMHIITSSMVRATLNFCEDEDDQVITFVRATREAAARGGAILDGPMIGREAKSGLVLTTA